MAHATHTVVRAVTVTCATRLGLWAQARSAHPLALGLVSLLLLLGQTPLAGIAAGGTVTGIARDALEQPLAGAAVRLETRDGQVLRRTSTDTQGRFIFPDVPAGRYTVVAEREDFEAATATGTVTDTEDWRVDLLLASHLRLDSMVVTAQRREDPRVLTTPRAIGAPTYEITDQAIQIQPGGANNTLTQVLRQMPGVTQDASSVGGIHVRNQMGNLQYRINGVALPEGITLFGQSGGLSPRLAASVTLLTGVLPAEYGLRTTGIFDITTKSGALEPGGDVGVYGGSPSWLQRGLRLRRSAWRAARTAGGLPGGLPRSPQPLACGYGWGERPVGTRARCGEAPVGGLAGKVALIII